MFSPHISALVSVCLTCASAEGLGALLKLGHPHTDGVPASGFGGDGETKMTRIFKTNDDLPLGADKLAAEWTRSSHCDSHLGYAWTKGSSGVARREQPLKLYTNAAGQPSGIGVVIFGYFPKNQKKWATESPLVEVENPSKENLTHIDIGFRNGDQCNEATRGPSEIGDVLIVNPGKGDNSKQIALTMDEAQSQGWQKGSCFDHMGHHHFFNTNEDKLPMKPWNIWAKKDLFPVSAMYHDGRISTIFFASVKDQHTGTSTNNWDTRPLMNLMMCENFCGYCDFKESDEEKGSWGTMHIFFRDFTQVKCPSNYCCLPLVDDEEKKNGGPKIGCCPPGKDFVIGAIKCLVTDDDSDQVLEGRVEPATRATSKRWIWVMMVGGGSGLVVVGAMIGFVVSRKRQAREIQMSEPIS